MLPDPTRDTEAVGGKDTSTPAETVDEAQQQGAEAYAYAAAKLAGLDADDQSIYYTPLFTYAANPDAEKTISFANYLAALYQEIAENDRDHWPEGWTGSEFTALAGNGRAGVRRHQPRHAAGPAAQGSPVQLVSVSADTARTLAGLDGVSCTYQESLSEYEPAGDTVLIVTDTQTLASIGTENYTVLRDYGDAYWDVRMNINDLTENLPPISSCPKPRDMASDGITSKKRQRAVKFDRKKNLNDFLWGGVFYEAYFFRR